MLYAISDIHGCLEALYRRMANVDLYGDNKLIFLGDYIDYGDRSGQVLEFIYDLQREHGEQKIITLLGDRELKLLNWIDEYSDRPEEAEEPSHTGWLEEDAARDFSTFRTMVSDYQLDTFFKMTAAYPIERLNYEAAKIIAYDSKNLIQWLRSMPLFYEAQDTIFVHAGIDEEAEEEWKWGTTDEIFTSKFPPTKGVFSKTIVAGHTGTDSVSLSADPEFHGIYYDKKSHIYIDGSVYKEGGKLNLLALDETGNFYEISGDGTPKKLR